MKQDWCIKRTINARKELRESKFKGLGRGRAREGKEEGARKAANMSVFVGIVKRLQDAGFVVMYHGLGVWDALPEWTWHTDALIYCARE